jgi:hypothetical protein
LTALMNVGEPDATAWELPLENDLRHDKGNTFSRTRTLPFDSSMLDRTYTFDLAPVG